MRTDSPSTPRDSTAAGSPGAAAPLARVNEAEARALCLLRACEEGAVDAALWSAEDAAWASRLADQTVAAGAPPGAWLAERARHAQQRLLPRHAGLARLSARRTWRAGGARWLGTAAAAGFVSGLAADILGGGQQVNLLAAPVWAVAAWNIGVLLALGWASLRGAGAGPLRRVLQRWLGGAAAAVAPESAAKALAPERRFAALWAGTFAPVVAARAALLLHVAALALAAGLVAGMYARALVLDYRVGWQSTLLAPAQVHALLATALAPASALAGLAVPGAEAVAALRDEGSGRPLQGPSAGSREQAAPWLHLLAATLAWSVALPRLALAALAARQASRRARRLSWPVADAYALGLLRSRRGGTAGHVAMCVLPHGFAPSPAATLALRAWLAAWGGEALDLRVLPSTPYGDEDKLPDLRRPAPPAASSGAALPPAACLAWFELAATPEPQVQGRFVREVQAAVEPAALAMLVDESGYRQRLGAGSPRLAERRRAWQALAQEAGIGLVFVDLLQPAGDGGTQLPHALDEALAARTANPAARDAQVLQ